MVTTLSTGWLVAMMIAAAPPGRVPARETAEAGTARYAEIAADIADTSHDPKTQALLVAIAVHESGLRLDIDLGQTLGDGGRAVGLWQLQGVSHHLSRREEADIALARIQRSFVACAGNGPRFQLAAYASGSCARGLHESAAMVDSWKRMLVAHPPK